MLLRKFRPMARRMKVYPGGGQTMRMLRLRQIVTGLIRFERVEPLYSQADEARQYAERLLYLAVKNGDTHAETMELADFWILEKDLIHKLFSVLVPRYTNYKSCYTQLYKMAHTYPGPETGRGVLELKGNPWPPVITHRRETQFLLSNILLAVAQKDYYASKRAKEDSVSHTQQTDAEHSSSVDPEPEVTDRSKSTDL